MSNTLGHLKRLGPMLALVAVLAVSSCGGGSGNTAGAPAATGAKGTRTEVLPVARNPIANPATAKGLVITKVLVENNVSPTDGKAVDDHLEFVLRNTSTRPLGPIGVYYKITDPSKGTSEGYAATLTGLSINPGATRVVHFDNTGVAGHYPVNTYSLYYLDRNALVIDVMASAKGVRPATFRVRKDAGGAEAGVESGAPSG